MLFRIKKTISLLLTALMLFAVMPLTVIGVSEEHDFAFVIEAPSNVKKGETFNVTVLLNTSVPMNDIGCALTYDSDVLALTNATEERSIDCFEGFAEWEDLSVVNLDGDRMMIPGYVELRAASIGGNNGLTYTSVSENGVIKFVLSFTALEMFNGTPIEIADDSVRGNNFDPKTSNFTYYNGVGDSVSVIIGESLKPLAFSGASLTLQSDLTVNFKVKGELFGEGGYENPYVVFEFNGVRTEVSEYRVEGDKYVFDFVNIIPHQMNDVISATLYANYNGEAYSSATREYSVADYCYSMLSKYGENPTYAAFSTLLVDLLNYGAASQIYMGYNADALVNANLTDAQKALGTSTDRTYVNSMNTTFETIDNPTIKWLGGGLNLTKSVMMRFKISAENVENLSVRVTNGRGGADIITSDTFEPAVNGGYYVYFGGLTAAQMGEVLYFTVLENGVPVSNTLSYSIESYAYTYHNSSDAKLANLLKAMMRYGDSAKKFVG